METQLYKVFQFLGTRIIDCFPIQPLELYHEEKAGKNVSPWTLIHSPTIFNLLSNDSSQTIHEDKISLHYLKISPKSKYLGCTDCIILISPSSLFWHYTEQITTKQS